jgi:hypothetical protein
MAVNILSQFSDLFIILVGVSGLHWTCRQEKGVHRVIRSVPGMPRYPICGSGSVVHLLILRSGVYVHCAMVTM